MQYYTRKRRSNKRIIIFLSIIISVILVLLYIADRIILSTLMIIADGEVRAKSIEVINESILELYSKEFSYEDAIKIEKDDEGNITMVRADTIKLNGLASKVSLQAQGQLKDLGKSGIRFPLGYITKNILLSQLGPLVKVSMFPIGSVQVNYISEFESAGINQTRHKIYLEVEALVRVVVPTKSDQVQVKDTVPIAETIIVGKVPNTNLDFGQNKGSITPD